MTQSQQTSNGEPVADFGPDHPLTGAPIISGYSRKQAIEDGVLIDLSDIACPLFWIWPVACTAGVWQQLVAAGVDPKKEAEGGATYGRRAKQLIVNSWEAAQAQRNGGERSDILQFMADTDAGNTKVWARVTPGDDGESVVTIMLISED